jgi:hypothetical protein
MTNPVARLSPVQYGEHHYQAILFVCPGCEASAKGSGLHMLPVSGDIPPGKPQWSFDGNLEAPTLNPSILTRYNIAGVQFVCHSFIRAGQIQFLSDCTHELAGQTVSLLPMPDWQVRE